MIYSAIILFNETEDVRRLAELQHMIAKKFAGKSAIHLPTHMTLMKWESPQPISDRLRSLIHCNPKMCDVHLETIEKSPNNKSIWYKVLDTNELVSISEQIYQALLTEGISEKNVIHYNKLHVTLAYKDYSTEEIEKIFQFLKKMRLSSFRFLADKIAICTIGKDGRWTII